MKILLEVLIITLVLVLPILTLKKEKMKSKIWH